MFVKNAIAQYQDYIKFIAESEMGGDAEQNPMLKQFKNNLPKAK